jgi:predicted nucleotidyltransferase
MRPDSDIDLLIEFLPDANVGLIEHAGSMLEQAGLLATKVGVVSNGLKPRKRLRSSLTYNSGAQCRRAEARDHRRSSGTNLR